VPNPEVIDSARNYFPQLYPRLIEILQIIGASGHFAHVPESTASSEIGPLIETHYRTARMGGRERNRLFKLAWDTACSGFAGRQVLYERYFDGDLFRKRATRYMTYSRRDQTREHVNAFLHRSEADERNRRAISSISS
jgi:4-hydroxyphenylacetate 3-monooxygenase